MLTNPRQDRAARGRRRQATSRPPSTCTASRRDPDRLPGPLLRRPHDEPAGRGRDARRRGAAGHESVESENVEVGTTLGWVGALALRFATGEWTPGNRVRVDWFDPATPTVSQREDALAKRRAAGVLSREGYWDELGWSEARKAKERAYFEAEALDPVTRAIVDEVTACQRPA
jgi:hypothetical protein